MPGKFDLFGQWFPTICCKSNHGQVEIRLWSLWNISYLPGYFFAKFIRSVLTAYSLNFRVRDNFSKTPHEVLLTSTFVKSDLKIIIVPDLPTSPEFVLNVWAALFTFCRLNISCQRYTSNLFNLYWIGPLFPLFGLAEVTYF